MEFIEMKNLDFISEYFLSFLTARYRYFRRFWTFERQKKAMVV